ncbi:hypothetical protein M9H77_30852 [Catharanthus roseus]|uniref:Uncharacterized protein n=1 Tax=Catharanthus roseus TaxID=4058 RepID=A0ACB9ZYF1_CATRO|nr:hypothetical protein M9H77_30852 [Catharanthus roseus]
MLGTEDKGRNLEKELGAKNGTFLGYVLSFQDCQVGASQVPLREKTSMVSQASKEVQQGINIIASLFVDVCKEMTGFAWQMCSHFIEFASNQATYFTTLLISFDIDYGGNSLMSIDLMFLSIDHTLSLDQKRRMEFVEFIHFKNHEANDITAGYLRMNLFKGDADDMNQK